MYENDFWALSKLAYQHTGIVLGEHKKNLLYSRLSRRIRRLGLRTFQDYIAIIESGQHAEFDEFLNAITTNLTSFFRENHHFEFLRNKIFSEWEQQKKPRIRVWSAGCSTGEEPYSIAMTVREHFKMKTDFRILATDLDANVLAHARKGEYEGNRLDGLDERLAEKYFEYNRAQQVAVAKATLRDLIVFNRLNLLGDWPMKGQFDVIFCRNVLIYFDKDTQTQLVARYVNQLSSRGYLIIGHSENINRMNSDLNFIGQTIYQKKY